MRTLINPADIIRYNLINNYLLRNNPQHNLIINDQLVLT